MFKNYNINLKPGDVIDLYSSFSDKAIYIGKAELLEYISTSDTMYLDYEKLNVVNFCSSSLKITKDSYQDYLNKQYERINYVVNNSKSRYIKEFMQDVTRLCNRKINSYNKMNEQIDLWSKHCGKSSTLDFLINGIDRRYFLRYIQQTKIKNWSNTLFKLEKWKVKILSEDSFSKDFITIRKIPVVFQISPEENARKYRLSISTTYNNKRSSYK